MISLAFIGRKFSNEMDDQLCLPNRYFQYPSNPSGTTLFIIIRGGECAEQFAITGLVTSTDLPEADPI